VIDVKAGGVHNGSGMGPLDQWLTALGLAEYVPRFAENHIDFSIITDLKDQDLKELGISSLGHRRRILRAIAQLNSDGPSASHTPALNPAQPGSIQDPASSILAVQLQPVFAERRQLTVMFCDLVGSTAMSARLDPEDMREVIGAYQQVCTDVVEAYDGFIAKFMGDGVLAYFGYPRAHEHDAERAIRAALAIVEALPKLDTCAVVKLQVRVGIATGLVVVGDLIGAGAAQEQAVVGETPNIAARLQQLADPGAVVIASSTRKLAAGLFEYRDLGAVVLKGFSDDVLACEVLGQSAAQSRFEAQHATGLTPVVGREKELSVLLQCWRRAKSGEGQVVTLVGEPGIGKSRITQAVQERVEDEPHSRLRYFCSPHHQGSPLYPLIAQLGLAAGFLREDGADTKFAKLQAVLSDASLPPDEIGLIAELLSLQTSGRYHLPESSPQKRKEKTLEALVAHLTGLATQQPVLVLFEDVHWIDPSSLELLSLIVGRVSQHSVLLIITARPEFNAPWSSHSHCSMLSLTRLNPGEGAALVQRVAGNKLIPERVMKQVLARTDGVPLFIEELTKTVLESGFIGEQGGEGSLPPLLIPATLQGSLLARLDRLAPVREVAQIGAALGRQFSQELIGAIAVMPEKKLQHALEQLVAAELIFQCGSHPNAEYMFKHALVQDAAYSTLLRSQRQQLHARIALTLERQFPDLVAAQPEILAQHCTEAGLSESAIDWWRKAGELAVRRFAFSEAISHLQKAIGLAEKLPDGPAPQLLRLRIQSTYGQALFHARGQTAPETAAAFARARQLAAAVEDATERSSAYFGLWAASSVRSELTSMRDVAGAFLRDAQRWPGSLEAGVAHRVFGTTCWMRGDYLSARLHLEQALRAYDHKRDRNFAPRFGYDAGVMAGYWLAIVLWALGDIDRVPRLAEQATSLGLQCGHVPTSAHGHWFTCFLAALSRRPGQTTTHAETMLRLGREHGLPLWVAHGTFYLGWTQWSVGNRDGETGMREGLSLLRERDIRFCEPLPKALVAEVEAELGRVEGGLAILDAQLAENKQTEQHWFDAEVHRIRGELLLRREPPDVVAAKSAFKTATDIARAQHTRTFELRAALSLAKLYKVTGQHQEVRDLLLPALTGFSEGPDLPEVAEANRLLASLAKVAQSPERNTGRLRCGP
jgi:class 3 adenylate cyclase/predicted ATPase